MFIGRREAVRRATVGGGSPYRRRSLYEKFSERREDVAG